jgi:CheY-like chemotaxis protein
LIRDLRAALGSRMPRVAIALSAYATSQDQERSLEAGFQQHVAKPVDPQELVRTLFALLSDSTHTANPPVET